jgi:hypothetical protein
VFTIMTWNIENFFQPQLADRADFDAKLDALADVIMAAEPDLLAVQEVGDEVAFAALRDELGAGWSGEPSTHFSAGRPTTTWPATSSASCIESSRRSKAWSTCGAPRVLRHR